MASRWASRAMLGGLLLVSACYAGVEASPPVVGGYATYYPSYVPSDIYARPYVYYEGYPAYWVENRWYWRGPSGWAVFQRSPPALERQRPYVQQAPPAPRSAPYAYPPPAIRVR